MEHFSRQKVAVLNVWISMAAFSFFRTIRIGWQSIMWNVSEGSGITVIFKDGTETEVQNL